MFESKLLRHDGREHVFHSGTTGEVQTYGDLVIEAGAGRRFLSDSFLEKLNAALDLGLTRPDATVDNAP
jgi:hypothetical protein